MNEILVHDASRTIYLYDRIDYEKTSSVIFNIMKIIDRDNDTAEYCDDYKPKPIKLYISTDGGDVDAMWGLVDVITNSKTPIHTYCLGRSASCGFAIFIAGHKRFITKHSKLMIHSSSTSGNMKKDIEQLNDLVRTMNDWEEEFYDYVINNTKISKEMLTDMRKYRKDWYINAKQAIELGCADEII